MKYTPTSPARKKRVMTATQQCFSDAYIVELAVSKPQHLADKVEITVEDTGVDQEEHEERTEEIDEEAMDQVTQPGG